MKRRFWTLTKIGLAIAMIGVFFREVPWTAAQESARAMHWRWIAAVFILLFLILTCQARRYWHLLDKSVGFAALLRVVILQSALTSFMATAAAAVAYVGVLKQEENVKLSQSIGAMLLCRLAELIVLSATLVLSACVLQTKLGILRVPVFVVGGAITSICFVCIVIVLYRLRILPYFRHIFDSFQVMRFPLYKKIFLGLESLAETPNKSFARWARAAFVYSLNIYILQALGIFCILQAFRIEMNLAEIALVSNLPTALSILPIMIFGGVGVYDVSAFHLYIELGAEEGAVAAMIIASRIIYYFFNATLLLPLLIRWLSDLWK